MSNIPTPHNECKDKDLIAKTVLMPGDPLRAKYIAETYLTDVVCFNSVRNMLGYTGKYNGKKITVMGSGMGMPSIGIYSYELFAFYDVENIIRIGSAGSYSDRLNVYDTVLVTKAFSESSYASVAFGNKSKFQEPSKYLNSKLKNAAEDLGINLKEAIIHSSDVFYSDNKTHWMFLKDEYQCEAVEMESFALFANAKALNKKAACLLTISDSFVSKIVTTSEERQKNFNDMIKLALKMA